MVTQSTVRELKLRLSEYLTRVEAGETIIVTKRGKLIARIQPAAPPNLPDRLRALIVSGRATYATGPISLPTPVPLLPGDKTGVDYVREQRR